MALEPRRQRVFIDARPARDHAAHPRRRDIITERIEEGRKRVLVDEFRRDAIFVSELAHTNVDVFANLVPLNELSQNFDKARVAVLLEKVVEAKHFAAETQPLVMGVGAEDVELSVRLVRMRPHPAENAETVE